MVNFRIIWKILGSLLFIEAFFMAWCLGVALLAREDDVLAFLLSMLLTACFGFVSRWDARPRISLAVAMPLWW